MAKRKLSAVHENNAADNQRLLPLHVSRKVHRGTYLKLPKIPASVNSVLVGPFVVHLSRKDPNFTLFTCSVLGVEITRQISYPSLQQLADDLTKAVGSNLLKEREVEKLWKSILLSAAT